MMNRASQLNQKVDRVVSVVDTANLMTVFTFFLTDVLRQLLQESARFILFPVSGAMALTHTILAIRQARLDKGKNGTLANAIIETISALGIMTTVVGGFVAASIFATVSPIIFTVIMSGKTLFHLCAVCYYLGCAAATKNDPATKANYMAAARAHGVATTALALASVAVALVMIAAKPIMGILGIVAGAIAMSYTIYKLVTSSPLPPKGATQEINQTQSFEHRDEYEPGLTNSAKMHKTFNIENAQAPNSLRIDMEPAKSSLWLDPQELQTATEQTPKVSRGFAIQ